LELSMSSNHIFSRAMKLAKQAPGVPVTPAEAPSEPKIRPRFMRQRTETLVFVSLDSENAGLPGSVRKVGPAFQGIKRLTAGQSLNVIFKLPGIDGWLRATANVVWVSNSGKAGGLQFVDIPGESRRLVDNWLALRAQASRADATAGSQASTGNTKAAPAPPVLDMDSYQIVLPVEAIEIIPGPQPYSAPPAPVALAAMQASMRSDVPRVEASVAKSVAAPPLPVPASFAAASRVRTPQEGVRIERSSTRTFVLALAGLVAMFAIAGVVIWQLRGALSLRPLSAQPAQPEISSAPIETPPPQIVESQNSLEAPQSKSSTVPIPMPSAPSATAARSSDRPEKTGKPAMPQKTAAQTTRSMQLSEVSHLGTTRPAQPQQIVRATPPSATNPPSAEARPAGSVPAAPPTETANEKPANSISDRPPVEAAARPAIAERSPVPATAPPASPVSPTGSIEVVTDPYPSIRPPAGPKSKPSGPAALTIGRLVSKVDPVYPSDALQQRISGTVKLHIVVGMDGRVETASVTEGPAQLRNAALRAVEQWRYEPTLLGSAPVEAEEDVALVFRIVTPSHPAN
jgi:periplasmic protein TonB